MKSENIKEFLAQNNLVDVAKANIDNVIIENPVPYFVEPNPKLSRQHPNQINAFGTKLYGYSFFYLHQDAFAALKIAAKLAKESDYKLKLWDGFRPFEVQAFMAEKFPQDVEGGYVSHPKTGVATHIRGIAVDLTLVDENNNQLDMGTKFDEMSELSHHDYLKLPESTLANRKKLKKIMMNAGFMAYNEEWWHYNLNQNKTKLDQNNNEILAYPKIMDAPKSMLSAAVKDFFKI
ncbi:MAG: M15 family metallopeptidase [Rickettsiales bacterium]|nr:M15 family metallopeptidase [Rickettsiales bacterium]